jgi:diguanylate cyclase (GGDEF)-like protein
VSTEGERGETEEERALRPRTLAEVLGNPHALPLADRALYTSALMIPTILLFAALMGTSSGWPYLPGEAPADGVRTLGALSLLVLVPWVLLAGIALWLRRRRGPERRVLMYATVQLYALTCGLFTTVTGPFDSPGWILFIGGAIVGFVQFERRAVFAGVAVFFVIVVGGAVAIHSGVASLDVLLQYLSGTHGQGYAAIARQALLSITFSLGTLGLVSYIIDRWRERELKLERLSRTDALTGLTNRRRFLEVCEYELGRARRYGTHLSVIIVDLDHFKKVNDTRGHLAGDRTLAAVAGVLAHTLRDVDTAARYGGEEFAVLLPDTDAAGAAEVATRCLRRIAKTPFDAGEGPSLSVTASMGVAAFPDAAVARIEDLLRRADEALYRAKEGGRNQVVVAEPTRRSITEQSGPVLLPPEAKVTERSR